MIKFEKVINLIIREDTEILVRRFKDLLKGNWKGDRECDIEDDWLLSYKINRGKIQVN
ncbi:type II toxin-antitoxin system mRNA interferase toxin, RelE/StbE family [uncultured Vagococcus sp.]|uniref:type II toxin-antitoxin system mRNA interferase toxin, RelE/StbE family n=1 Tax=uncultured Vagococcus sp. TaxID=189676 RepID=UPI0028D66DA5|nr:type II toxin-antitoxin system mRNA interferase toxin, RelE/StbE family [uncultured Vagococcus sp.]